MENELSNLIEKLKPISEEISKILAGADLAPTRVSLYVASDGYIHIMLPGYSLSRESGYWLSRPERV